MIKNDANKCAKQIESKTSVTTTPTSVRQQSNNDVDNRHVLTSTQRTANKYNDVDDNDSCKPLSKMDLIKKFDSKYNQSESVDNKSSQRSNYDEQKINTIPDDVENDENIQNSNNEETIDSTDIRCQSDECESTANNNYKNGNQYGGNNANGNEIIPPKPLPRTSRNNSVSSLSSEHGISIAPNPIDESTVRPVAKPRTTTTSYKVQDTPQ